MSQSFYSQAVNFASSLQAEVDVRTGLYKAVFPMVKLVANQGIGPVQDISLSYNPLDSSNSGFGNGWNLGISSYDKQNQLLVTANGDQYKVLENNTSVTIQENKLDNIRFIKFTDHYKIIYKTGVVEILSSPSSVNNVKVPQKIYSPAGRTLTFNWNLAGTRPKLLSIRDERSVLLEVSYSGATIMTVWPGSVEQKKITLIQSNNQLTSFTIATEEDNQVWRLHYQTLGATVLLSGMDTPSGMSESVTYIASQIQFPTNAKQASLPRVTSHTRLPGAQQAAIHRSFQYSSNNFLGFGLLTPWTPNTDSLYNISTPYDYWSEERLQSSDGVNLIVTRRTFNNFHLLTEEKTTEKNCQKITAATYYAIANASFSQQPNNFLCQKSKEVTWHDAALAQERTERTEFEFDLNGNLLKQTDPDGKIVSWAYYSPEGEEGCPADPYGFHHFLKSETTTPAPSSFDTPQKMKSYTYSSMPVATAAQSELAGMVVLTAENFIANDQMLMSVAHRYLDDPAGVNYGREYSKTTRKAGNEGEALGYPAVENIAWSDAGEYYRSVVDFFPYDYDSDAGNTSSVTVEYYPFSQKERVVTDAEGNTVEYIYDVLDRIKQTINNKGTAFESQVNYTYAMEEVTPGTSVLAPVMVVMDAKGNEGKNTYDGLGRLIRQAKKVNGKWETLFEREYDSLGREFYNARYDRLGETEAVVSQTISYNDWGIVNAIQYNDGHTEHNEYDPTTLQARLWQSSAEITTGTTTTFYDINGAVVRQDKIDNQGMNSGTKRFEYDGLGQLRKTLNENAVATEYTYDSFGRVINTLLSDGTKIKKEYAPHSTEKLIANIYVNESWLGEQTFDGMSRLTKTTHADRIESCFYLDDKSVPHQITMADGVSLHYDYIPELKNAVKSVKNDAGLQLQTLSYDPVTGAVLDGVTHDGISFTHTYNADSTLATEAFTDAGHNAASDYQFSRNGILTDYTGTNGVQRRSVFNAFGQCTSISEGNVTNNTTFDTLGRVKTVVTKDTSTNVISEMTLTYDDFGREKLRFYTCGLYRRSIEQEYYQNNALCKRVTRDGNNILLSEIYEFNHREQLADYYATGASLPVDKYGNEITHQRFAYDVLGNVTTVQTDFSLGQDVAEYHYENADPCQLTRVTHSHPDYPSSISLSYDAAGRMIKNEAGNTLVYDELGRMSAVQSGGNTLATYYYDALDRLVRQHTVSDQHTHFYYREGSIASLYHSAASTTTNLLQVANQPHASVENNTTRLYLTDLKGTPSSDINTRTDEMKVTAFTAFGGIADADPGWQPAFNGQFRDPVTGYYHLGGGYRAYNPELMRFNTPDSWSPFGAGGINPYSYCQNDPINFTDPSGHISWQNGVKIGLGVFSLVLAIVTAGASIIVEGGVMAAIAAADVATLIIGAVGIIGTVTSIASYALEESNPAVANVLSWVSKVCSVISFGNTLRKVPGYIKEAPDMIHDMWSKARGRTGSGKITKFIDTRSVMVKTADRFLTVTDSTAFSVVNTIVTSGTKFGISVYDYISQKKEGSTTDRSEDETSNTSTDTTTLKTQTQANYLAASMGMQNSEDIAPGNIYAAQQNNLNDTLSPLMTQTRKTGLHLVNPDSLTPWSSTVSFMS
nr:RHS repeat-associated core domain-containing protein [uncultured Enterobacter sp.]